MIEINDSFQKVINLLENTSTNLFLTGKAGTGKSTLLTYFRENTKKKVVVLAPTGVAAINVKGQTIHSFFKFGIDLTLDKVKKLSLEDSENIYKKLDLLIIDEISMVRADLLDCIDKFLQLNRGNFKPFGGVQMVFIGDLYQLPPVITKEDKDAISALYQTPFFFSARVFNEREQMGFDSEDFKIELIELEKIYRQSDSKFIKLLNQIRDNSISQEGLNILNERYIPNFQIPENEFYIYLTTTNRTAIDINYKELDKVNSKMFEFKANIEGDFEKNSYPNEEIVYLKIGAQVMLLNNDQAGRWVNGSLGEVLKIDEKAKEVLVQLDNGSKVEVGLNTWNIYKFKLDQANSQIKTEVAGSFIQFPIKLAWAITIHKSQGKTFDKVIIDLGYGSFAHGQTYVALSRCTSLEGIVLKKRLEKRHIIMDQRVTEFLKKFKNDTNEVKILQEEQQENGFNNELDSSNPIISTIKQAIKDDKKLWFSTTNKNGKKQISIVKPIEIKLVEHNNETFPALKAYSYQRQEERIFNINNIVSIGLRD